METFLRETKHLLESAQGDSHINIHVVLGNEACDLDSAVSSLVWAYHLSKHQETQDTIVPVLNIPRHEFRLRTEVTHFLSALNHDSSLVFRDDVDLNSLHAEGRLSLTLVDHNTLPKGDAPLDAAVKEIIDHHSSNRHDNEDICVTIETVGSCSTLVAEKILADNSDVIDESIAKLLLGPILVDTVNLSASSGKATPKDTAMVEELSKFCPDLDKDQMYQDLQQAKADIAGFTSEEILRKDFKCVTGSSMNIGMSSIPMNLNDFVEKPSVERDLHDFCTSKNIRLLVLMSLTLDQDDEAHRQISVYSSSTSDSMKDELLQTLDESSSPSLILSELDTDSPGVVVYSQGNVKASRKQVLPLVKDFLNSQENSSATEEEEQEEEVVTESDMSDINATLMRLSSNANNANDPLTSDDPFDMGDNQAISSPDSSGIDAGSVLLDLDLFQGNQNGMPTSESGTFSSADSAGTLGFTPTSPGSDAVGFGNGTEDLLGLDPFGSGQPTDSTVTPVPPSNSFEQSSGDDLFGLDAFMTQPAAASDPTLSPFGDPVIHDYAADPFGVSITVDPEAQETESTSFTLSGNSHFGMDGETSSSDLLGLGTLTASTDSESQPLSDPFSSNMESTVHTSVSTTVESSLTDLGDCLNQQPGSPDQEYSKDEDDTIGNDQDGFLVTSPTSNPFTVSDETKNDPFGMDNFESQTSEPKLEDGFQDPFGGTVVSTSAEVNSFAMDASGFGDGDQSEIPDTGVIKEPFEELDADPPPSFVPGQDEKEMSSGSNFDQDELDVQGSPHQEDSLDEDDTIGNDQDGFLVTSPTSNPFTVSDETKNDPFWMDNFESQTSEPKLEDGFQDPFGGTVVSTSAEVDSFAIDASGFGVGDQSEIPDTGVIKEPFEELDADPPPSFVPGQDEKEMSSGSNFDQDELDVQGSPHQEDSLDEDDTIRNDQDGFLVTSPTSNPFTVSDETKNDPFGMDNFESQTSEPKLEDGFQDPFGGSVVSTSAEVDSFAIDASGFGDGDQSEIPDTGVIKEPFEELDADPSPSFVPGQGEKEMSSGSSFDQDELDVQGGQPETTPEITITQTSDNEKVVSDVEYSDNFEEESPRDQNPEVEDEGFNETEEAEAASSLQDEINEIWDEVKPDEEQLDDDDDEYENEEDVREDQEVDQVVTPLEENTNTADEEDNAESALDEENIVLDVASENIAQEVSDVIDDSQEDDVQSFQPMEFEETEEQPSEAFLPEKYLQEVDDVMTEEEEQEMQALQQAEPDKVENQATEAGITDETLQGTENIISPMIDQEVTEEPDNFESEENEPSASTEESIPEELSFEDDRQRTPADLQDSEDRIECNSDLQVQDSNRDDEESSLSEPQPLEEVENVVAAMIAQEMLDAQGSDLHHQDMQEDQESISSENLVIKSSLEENVQQDKVSVLEPGAEEDDNIQEDVEEENVDQSLGDDGNDEVLDSSNVDLSVIESSKPVEFTELESDENAKFYEDQDSALEDSEVQPTMLRDTGGFSDLLQGGQESERSFISPSDDATYPEESEPLEQLEEDTLVSVSEAEPLESSKVPGDLPLDLVMEAESLERNISPISDEAHTRSSGITSPESEFTSDVISEDPSSGDSYTVTDISRDVTNFQIGDIKEEEEDQVTESTETTEISIVDTTLEEKLEDLENHTNGDCDVSLSEEIPKDLETGVVEDHFSEESQSQKDDIDRISIPTDVGLCDSGRSSPKMTEQDSSVMQEEAHDYVEEVIKMAKFAYIEKLHQDQANLEEVSAREEGEEKLSNGGEDPVLIQREMQEHESAAPASEALVNGDNILEASSVSQKESSLYAQEINLDDEEPSGQFQEASGESEADQILSASLIQQEYSASASEEVFGNSLIDEVTPGEQLEDTNEVDSLNGDIEEPALEHHSEEILQATSVSVESTEPLGMAQTREGFESSYGAEDVSQPGEENDLPVEPMESVVEVDPTESLNMKGTREGSESSYGAEDVSQPGEENDLPIEPMESVVEVESTKALNMEQTREGSESSSYGAEDVLQPGEENNLPVEPVESVVEEEISQVVVSQEESVMSSNPDVPSADKDEEVQDISEPEVVATSEANTEQGVPLNTEENPGDTAEEPQSEIEVNIVISEQGLQDISGKSEETSLGKTKLVVEDDVKDVDIDVEREEKPAALFGLADILEYVDPDGNVEGSADSAVRPSTLSLPNRSTPKSHRLLSTGTPGSALSDTGTPLTPISISSFDMLTSDPGTDDDILDKSQEDLAEEGGSEKLAAPLAAKRSVSIDPDMAEDIHGEWDDKKRLMEDIVEKERRKSMTEKPTHHRELSVATAEAMKNMEGVTLPDEWQDDEFSQQKLAGVDSTQEEESFFRRRVPSQDGKLRTRDSMMSDDGSVEGMSAWAERLAGDDNFDEDEDGDLSPLQANSKEQRNRKGSNKKVVHIPAGLDISIDAEVNDSATAAILTPTSTEMSWDDDTLQAPRGDVDAIPEYTAQEESEDRRNWRKVVIANKEFTVDMRAINPYKKVLSHGGYYGEGVNAIIVVASCYMPERSRKDYNYIMNNLFLYVISTLELLVAQDYMIVYFHGAAPKDRIPSLTWMRKCYQMIDRKLRKNLKGLYIVHPTTWLRTIVRFTRPFISSKFSRKLKFVENLEELSTMVTMEYVYVPDEVRRFDEERSEKEGNALWGQYAMAVSRCSMYLWCLPSAVAAAQCTLGFPWLAMSEAVSWWISGKGRSGSESGSCYTMGPDFDTTNHDEEYVDEMLYCPTSRAARRRMSMQLRRGNFALYALSRERAKDFEDYDSSDYIEDDMFGDIEDDGGEEEEEEEETDGRENNLKDEDTVEDEKCNDLHQDLEYDEEFHQFTNPQGPHPRYHPGEQHRHYTHHPLETVNLEETRKAPPGTHIQWHKRKQSDKR